MNPTDTAKVLGIAPGTLRKWSQQLAPLLSKEAGNPVPGEARRYSEQDLATLHQVKALLTQRLTYAQIREHYSAGALERPTGALQHHEAEPVQAANDDVHEQNRSSTVVVLNERPELEQVRALLLAQNQTLQVQSELIEQLRQDMAQTRQGAIEERQRLERQVEDTRTDLAAQLAEMHGKIERVPRWIRVLLGL